MKTPSFNGRLAARHAGVILLSALFLLPCGAAILEGLPEEFEVQAIGTYNGDEPVAIQLDDAGHLTRQATVVVNRTDKPIVLVLSAYDPVVWNIGRTEGTEIAGVVVSGYHGQAAISITKATPLAISSYEMGGPFDYFSVFSDDGLLELNHRIEAELGEPITLFQNESVTSGNETYYLIGDAIDSLAEVQFSDEITLDDYRDPDRPLAGFAALQALLDDGKLRLATLHDINDWIEKASQPYLKFNPNLRVPTPGRMYLWKSRLEGELDHVDSLGLRGAVFLPQQSFTLPDGLYGANAVAFILPEGSPLPDGPRGHNAFYFDDGTEFDRRGTHGRRPPDDSALEPILGSLAEDTKILAVGTYNGIDLVPDVQLDLSGHDVKVAEVVVHEPDHPVVLVLSAYDPTVWNVGLTEGTNVTGIIVSGYHGQALTGISADIPYVISTHEVRADFDYFYAIRAEPSLLRLNERIKAVSGGKELSHMTFEPTERIFEVGQPRTGAENILYPGDLTLDQFIDPSQPLAGQRGLDALVAEGKIRLATMADIEAYIDEKSEVFQEIAPGIRATPGFHLPFTYVILDAMTFPPGLFGAHSRTFLLPRGVPEPSGDLGHSRVHRIDISVADVAPQAIAFADWMEDLEVAALQAPPDIDGDGLEDAVEFVLGSDPENSSDRGKISISIEHLNGQPYALLRLPMRKNGTGVEPVLECSSNGSEWKTVVDELEYIQRSPSTDSVDIYHFRTVDPVSSLKQPQLFRLRVGH